MKYLVVILIFLGFYSQAQFTHSLTESNGNREEIRENKENVKSSKQRRGWEQQNKQRLMEELEISKNEDQQKFEELYDEYNDNQNRIKRKFRPNRNYDQLSDREAKQQLDDSFRVGEELLQNRRRYSQEFQKVLKPQKVLKMFEHESRMRNKMMNRREENSNLRK